MSESANSVPEGLSDDHPVVFLHGWCGHADEIESIRSALPGPVLALPWMPAPGSYDIEAWPLEDREPGEAEKAMLAFADEVRERVRQAILDAGFKGATLIGHSLGGGMSCVLAADPSLEVRRVVLLDSSAPMPDDRRQHYVEQMLGWVDRAATGGRLVAQAGWIAQASSWVPEFFSLEDQGPTRLRIERRFLFSPVVEAAMMIGGAVQWPINESLASLDCEIHALAGDPGRMPVDTLREMRPDAGIETCEDTGHFVHQFAAERTRAWLEGIFSASAMR